MGPGVDPHLYKATPGDLSRLDQADLIVYNGLHLEGKMGEIFSSMADKHPVVAWAAGISPERIRSLDGQAQDPHIWFDVALWASGVPAIAEALAQADPAHAEGYRTRARVYQDSLMALDQVVRQTLQAIPDSQRVLITAHDAFGYWGAAYQVEVHALQGISTVAEFGLQDVAQLVDLIVSRRIRAVFVESSVPPRSIEAVVAGCQEKGHAVRIGGSLYSDALGESDGPAGTYAGMVRTNLQTMTQAMQ
jgi:manganese/zinc/iron transport system substrate-binding protein